LQPIYSQGRLLLAALFGRVLYRLETAEPGRVGTIISALPGLQDSRSCRRCSLQSNQPCSAVNQRPIEALTRLLRWNEVSIAAVEIKSIKAKPFKDYENSSIIKISFGKLTIDGPSRMHTSAAPNKTARSEANTIQSRDKSDYGTCWMDISESYE
jgi:hypothetical protein